MQRRTFLNIGLAGLGTTLAMSKSAPAQFLQNPSTEKWAILFGTWCGSARDAGIWISEGMNGIAAVIDIRQVTANFYQTQGAVRPLDAVLQQHPDLFKSNQAAVDPAAYDHLIIGTAIHGGKGPAALEAYLNNNVDRLQGKIRGHFAVCGAMGGTPGQTQITNYIDNYLATICGTRSLSLPRNVFAGRITKALMSAADKATIGNAADYDHLSRAQCMALGAEILAANA
jgi:menaquinone-dependent protoporphyrinogen IX oxidase